MKNIEIQLGKRLKLHKAIFKILDEKETLNMQKSIQMFDSYIKSLGLKPKGPLITKNRSLVEDNIIKNEVCLIGQIENTIHQKLEYPYSFEDEFVTGKCLYAHYSGDKEHILVAKSKIEVVAYENDIRLTNELYNVFLEEKEGIITLDVFAPIYEK